MQNPTIQLFENAIAGLQRTAVTGHYQNGISTVQFADIMFQIADELKSVTCKPADENHLCFLIGDGEPHLCEFAVNRMFRSVLAGAAQVVWSQNPATPENQKFNPYGDKQEVSYTNSDGLAHSFQVETANTNGKPFFFAIHKLSEL